MALRAISPLSFIGPPPNRPRESPLWVKSGHGKRTQFGLLRPAERTSGYAGNETHPLFIPNNWKCLSQFFERHVVRLLPIQDRTHDIRR